MTGSGLRRCDFTMKVVDVFSFRDGRTIFIGEVVGPDYIADCECDFLLNGVRMTRLKLDGEMMHPNRNTGWRAVSTSERIDESHLRSPAGMELRGLAVDSS
jgi:hypothetical protein